MYIKLIVNFLFFNPSFFFIILMGFKKYFYFFFFILYFLRACVKCFSSFNLFRSAISGAMNKHEKCFIFYFIYFFRWAGVCVILLFCFSAIKHRSIFIAVNGYKVSRCNMFRCVCV